MYRMVCSEAAFTAPGSSAVPQAQKDGVQLQMCGGSNKEEGEGHRMDSVCGRAHTTAWHKKIEGECDSGL